MAAYLASYFNGAVVACVLLGAIWSLYRHGAEIELEPLVIEALAGGLLPTGAILLLAAFNLRLLTHVEGAGIYIAVAGLVVFFVGIKALW